MYKAQSPEMEDYVRHTLQDLKTLTRGLAAPNHRLSHAAAEWKADLTQRLTAAHVRARLVFESDEDILLSVVQWSALTRVLRELVSNAIAHAQAHTRRRSTSCCDNDRLDLQRQRQRRRPQPARLVARARAWAACASASSSSAARSSGASCSPRGIGCRVTIRELSARA